MQRLLIFFLLLFPLHLSAMVDEKDLINGVSAFLEKRAEDNLIYIFEVKIKDNDNFKCYFPTTYKRLKYSHLKEWLLYPHGIWEKTITEDIETMGVRALAVSLENKYKLSKTAAILGGDSGVLLQNFEVDVNGTWMPLSSVPTTGVAKDIVGGFSKPVGDLIDALNSFRPYHSPCDSPQVNYATFKKSIDGILNLDKGLTALRHHLITYGDKLRLSDKGKTEFCQTLNLDDSCHNEVEALKLFKETILNFASNNLDDKTRKDIERAQQLLEDRYNAGTTDATDANKKKKTDADTPDTDKKKETDSVSERVLTFIDLLQDTRAMEDKEIEQLSRTLMFFAQISDSKDGAQVTKVLEAYTVPAVSFMAKREPGAHVNLTAYLGVGGGFNYSIDPAPEERTSIYAPIGLEWTWGRDRGDSVSVMIAPVDFGYPITQRLNGNDSDAQLSDVFAPSVAVAYGWKAVPVTLGVAYQQGRYLSTSSKMESRWLAFVGFDMPLWNFR